MKKGWDLEKVLCRYRIQYITWANIILERVKNIVRNVNKSGSVVRFQEIRKWREELPIAYYLFSSKIYLSYDILNFWQIQDFMCWRFEIKDDPELVL